MLRQPLLSFQISSCERSKNSPNCIQFHPFMVFSTARFSNPLTLLARASDYLPSISENAMCLFLVIDFATIAQHLIASRHRCASYHEPAALFLGCRAFPRTAGVF